MAHEPLFTRLDPAVADPASLARVVNQLVTVIETLCSFIDALDDRIALIEELLELDPPGPAMVDAPDISTYQEAT